MKLSKILRSVVVALLLSITFEVTTAHGKDGYFVPDSWMVQVY